MADYAFLAVIMTKYDLKLAEVREDLVPEQIEEEDFWNNYFYQLETIKKAHNLPNQLGQQLSDQVRMEVANDEISKLEEPPKPAAAAKTKAAKPSKKR